MEKFKKFLEKKKLDLKFKKAGTGVALAAGSASSNQQQQWFQPSPPKQVPRQGPDANVAAAALQRTTTAGQPQQKQLTRSQQAVRAQAKKELEAREQVETEQQPKRNTEIREMESASVMDEVLFTCEILGDHQMALPRGPMMEAVTEFLEAFYQEEPLPSAILMVHSLNRDREKRQVLLDTLCRYLDNLIGNPEEEKFRKIRMSNKAFQERVLSCRGGREFLEAVGFRMAQMCPSDGAPSEPYLFLPLQRAKELDLEETKAILMTTEPVRLKLHRNPKVLYQKSPSGKASQIPVPDSFFDRTSEEIKREQESKSTEVDKLLSLRTKEMRERDEKLRINKYRYCLLRVNFPDGFILEGTFGVHELLEELRKYVQSCLHSSVQWAPFILKTPEGKVLHNDSLSLADLGLVPAALLHFELDPDVIAQLADNKSEIQFLDDGMKSGAEPI